MDLAKKHTLQLPRIVCILPVFSKPYFPGLSIPIKIDSGIQYETVKNIIDTDLKYVGVLLYVGPYIDDNHKNLETKFMSKIGVVGQIKKIEITETGGYQATLNLKKRFEIDKIEKESNHFWAKVKYIDDIHDASEKKLKAYSSKIVSTIKDLVEISHESKSKELNLFLEYADVNNPSLIADMSASLTTATANELQDVIETISVIDRLKKSLLLIKNELSLSKIQNDIDIEVEKSLNKTQKEFVLQEQLKMIKKELGIDSDDKHKDLKKFASQIEHKKIPDHVQKVISYEVDRLTHIDNQSSEYGISRNYLDWITSIPWGIYSKDNIDIKKTLSILNKAHWGMNQVKERICEMVGIATITGRIPGNIICLVGPPGVGKTTIARSIATALGKKFFKFSVGGMKDEAEIKGHRRTYVGSMPGKIIQALKTCQTMNPLILIDEADKMGSDGMVDPCSALLDVFDKEQNDQFIDYYIDLPCDISHVTFLLSANVIEYIPDPLLDRLEIINLSGYVTEEKMIIAQKHLITKNLQEVGLSKKTIEFSNKAIEEIIVNYARESGVRNLEEQIKKIIRKIIMRHINSNSLTFEKICLEAEDIKGLLGTPKFHQDKLIENPPLGVGIGLAWTSMGGDTLYVETLCLPSKKESMKLTGSAGSVMRESADIAISFCKKWTKVNGHDPEFFSRNEIHIHLPEGATPKDGPSAGITMVTAIISHIINKPMKPFLAMTGEITLNGNILPVGGIREKIASAKRSKLKYVIIPDQNRHEFEELPKVLKQDIEIYFVSSYEDVFKIVFT